MARSPTLTLSLTPTLPLPLPLPLTLPLTLTVNKVYRGVSGFGLPKILTEKNEHNVIGGVEFAFLSTTLDRDVAMKYARGHANPASGLGVVLEITPGLVDRGADLSWVSQYPFEQAAPSP